MLVESFFFNSITFKDPVAFVIPIFILFIVVEFFYITKKWHKDYDIKEAIASITMGLGSVVVNLGSKAIWIGLFFVVYEYKIFDFLAPVNREELLSVSWHLSHWWVWAILFIVEDFTFYWHHRTAHEIRVLWAGHVNHHSSEDYNFATALRQGWWEYVFKYIWWLWLPLIGFHPVMVLVQISFSLIYQFFLHTETVNKLGFLEYIMNTPSHHRVHHGADLQYLDRNYAGILIIWDRLFGTFEEEKQRPTYGITVNIKTKNIWKIAFHEIIAVYNDFKNVPGFKNKLNYLFRSPGWTHTGEDKRAKVLRKQIKAH